MTHDGLAMYCGSFQSFSDRLEDAAIGFDSTPAEVSIRFEMGDTVLVDETFTAVYQEVEICGNTCQQGDLEVAVFNAR